MKRLTTILSAILILCSIFTPLSMADYEDTPMLIQNSTLLSYSGSATELTLPEGITAIAPGAFDQAYQLQRVTLPSTLQTISPGVFQSLHLKKILVAPDNPTFYDVDGVLYNRASTLIRYPASHSGKEYDLPEQITRISDQAFASTDLTAVRLHDQTVFIGKEAFRGSKINVLSLPDGLQTIGDSAFASCEALSRLEIPDSVTELGQGALCSSGVSYVRLPKGLTRIPQALFSECRSLRQVTLPENLEAIEASAFARCDALQNFVIPDSVKFLGEYAFSGAKLPEKILLPAQLEVIEDFALCAEGANDIRVPSDNPHFIALGGVLFTRDLSVLIRYGRNDQDEYSVPKGIKKIAAGAFANQQIRRITLPESVEEIGTCAFAGIYSYFALVEYRHKVTIELSNTRIRSIGKGAFSGTNLIQMELPDSVREIADSAFLGCRNLQSIRMPDQMKFIGEHAFAYCTSLTSIQIPEGVTAILAETFLQCERLSEVSIPGSVRSIGYSAFENTALREVTLPEGVQTVEPRAFFGCNKMREIKVPDSVSRIGEYAFCYYDHFEAGYLTTSTRMEYNLGTTAARYAMEYSCYSKTPEGELGDVNSDGQIDASDALVILQSSVGLTRLDASATLRADVDFDGDADATDALLLLQRSVRLIYRFPLDPKYVQNILIEDSQCQYRYIL